MESCSLWKVWGSSEEGHESRLDLRLDAHFVLLSLMFLTSSGNLFILPFVTVPFPQLGLRDFESSLQTQKLTWLEKASSQKRGMKEGRTKEKKKGK